MAISGNVRRQLSDNGVFNALIASNPAKPYEASIVKFTDGGITSQVGFNSVLPAGILTNISPIMVEIVLRKRTADVVTGGKTKMLNWLQNDVLVPLVEKTGETKSYSDYDNAPTARVNPNFIQRGHYKFSAGVNVGRLEAAQMSEARISVESTTMSSALEALAVTFNDIGFNGFATPTGSLYPVYGILNDPSLPAYTATTTTVTAPTFDTVYKDISGMVQSLITQSGSNLDLNSKFRVCIANTLINWTTLLNSFGMSVAAALKTTIPNLEFEVIPEFTKAYNNANDVIYIIGENTVGGVTKTCDLGFSEIALASNIVAHENYTSQVMSSGSAGALFYKPFNVIRKYAAL